MEYLSTQRRQGEFWGFGLITMAGTVPKVCTLNNHAYKEYICKCKCNSQNEHNVLLRHCKSLAFTVCKHKDMFKILISAHVFSWKSDFHPTSSNMRKTYGMIGISDLALMIKLDRYLYFLTISLCR